MAIMTIMIVVNFLLYFLHFVELENFHLTWCNDWVKFPLVESTAKSDGIKGKSEPEPQDPSYVSSRDLQTKLCYHVGGNPINWANFWQFGSKREYNRPPWYNFDSMSRSTHTGCTKKKLKLSEILKIKFEQYIWCQGGGEGRGNSTFSYFSYNLTDSFPSTNQDYKTFFFYYNTQWRGR